MNNYPFQDHVEAFRVLIATFQARGILHYLIGGQARDLLLSKRDITPMALTRDIDFAIMVQDFGQFEGLRMALREVGFEETGLGYRMIWPKSRTMVDLLPFGEISMDDMVHFPPPAFDLSVLGFRELMNELDTCFIDQAQTLSMPIAPLHGIFLLKVISWDDRPEVRGKDLNDLRQILSHYWDFFQDEAYTHHFDIFEVDVESVEGWGARILGRHLGHPLSRSEVLRQRVVGVLAKQVSLVDPPGPMLVRFARESDEGDRNIFYAKELLEQVLLGIDDGWQRPNTSFASNL